MSPSTRPGGSSDAGAHAVPRVVVAAPGSGHGKTSVATGLLAAYAARGLAVSPHKVGPDYIDPGYHAVAAGRPGRNLDPWLVGEERVAPLFLHGARTPRAADVAVVEGVMGLFDGAAHPSVAGHSRGYASTAHVASLLAAPVVLVVDAARQGASVAALVHGFATYAPGVRLGGVVLNRVGSDRHEAILRDALDGVGVPVLGALRRVDALETPSRHLGLVPAAEREPEARRVVDALGDVVAAAVDLDAVLALARSAPPLDARPWHAAAEVAGPAPSVPPDRRPRVAVAGGAAFSFTYAEQAELLTAAGAEVVPVDPRHDETLPDGTDALVLGGGFPETYATELSANAALRADVSRLARGGAPVVAECAGLLYLARSLDGAPMCGVLDTDARMTDRLTLGYREAVALAPSVVADEGTRVRGHEFHRTACDPPAGGTPAWGWTTDTGPRVEGFAEAAVHASYLHRHPAGRPDAARRLVAAARRHAEATRHGTPDPVLTPAQRS